MTRAPLDSCRRRIGRAEFHRDAFGKVWNAFIETNPYILEFHVNVDGRGCLWIEQIRPVPDDLSFLLGEFLYQLRAALDGIIYECAVLIRDADPPPQPHRYQFPIYDDPETFKTKTGYLSCFDQDFKDALELMQPYKARRTEDRRIVTNANRILGILNDWARKDRHRKLHVVGSYVSSARPMVRIPHTASVIWSGAREGIFLEGKTEIAAFEISGFVPEMDVHVNPNLSIDVAVTEIPPPCGENDRLADRMHLMSTVVGRIVDAFEKLFGT